MEKKSKAIGISVLVIGLIITYLIWRFVQAGQPYERYLVGNIMGLLWVPLLSIFFFFRDNLENYGMRLPENPKVTWIGTGVCMLVIAAILYFPSKWPQFQHYYPIFQNFMNADDVFRKPNPFMADLGKMFFAETSYGLYMFCWEFFFRGYLTIGMSKAFGIWAVLIQTIPFTLLHVGKPIEEVVASFFAGLALGLIAYYSRSFLPAFVLHYWVSLVFDIMVILNKS